MSGHVPIEDIQMATECELKLTSPKGTQTKLKS